ncbi:translational activator of GCN4, partial [Serendipita sp. 399]
MLPILQKGSKNSDPRIREGVCLAVSEIVSNSSEAQREEHEDEIIMIVRRSLVDSSGNVRASAAIAFDILQDVMGAKAIDETIPTLLEALRQPGEGSGTALQALKEVMTVRASTVFPVLIPTLIATPMTAFNARALASLVTVAGNALSKRLTVILTALIRAVEHETDMELKADIEGAVSALLESISDMEGLQTLMLLLAGWVKNEAWTRRVSALNFFRTFCNVSTVDFSLYRPDWVRSLVTLMDDRQMEVVEAAVAAFDSFVKSIEKDDLDSIVVTLRRTIESTGAPGRTVPGFNIKGSVSSMVPVIVAGLTTGNNEQREQAAYAIGDLVERTEEVALKPYVVPFTGPLIRVATQATAFPPGVKVAILKSLGTMLEHIPAHVKPFFPQLSRTFVKSCSDSSSLAVRNAAAKGLGSLTKSNQTRIDALVTELISTAQASDDDAIAASLVLALAYVVRYGITSMGAGAKEACITLIEAAFRERHD